MGYSAQGNEFSYFMLIASNFLLNNTERANQYTVHPYIHSFCNNFSEQDAFTAISIPDVNPQELISPGTDFSMVAGEFIEVYSKQVGEWDSVITCFFIDTANNIIDYIKL